MLEEFGLVDKRQMVRNQLTWDNHFIMTYRKQPNYVCLNVDKLMEMDDHEKAELFGEIFTYLEE